MSFFGEPGYSAGPFHYPARPGIFDRIMQGLGAATGIANTVMGMVDLPEERRTKKLKGLMEQVGAAKAVAGDQPVNMDILGPKFEAAGVPVPKVTPESQAGMALQIPPTAGEAGPVEGSRMTRLDSPELAQRQGMADALPKVGGFMPMQPTRPKTLEEEIIRQGYQGGGMAGGKPMQELINLNTAIKHPINPETARHNQRMEGFAEKRANAVQTPQEKFDDWLTKHNITSATQKDLARYHDELANNAPRNQNIDDETGISMGPGKFRKPKGSDTVPIITEAQANELAAKGGKITKGTKIIKENDPEYQKARSEAIQFESRDLASSGRTPEQKMARVEELTQQALQSRGAGQAQRKGGGGQAQPANTFANLKEGQETTIGGVRYKKINGVVHKWTE